MRIAVLSDIHANLPALEAVLEKVDALNVGKLACLGDTVGYGPFPQECLDIVRSRCEVVLKGNHDSGLIGETSIEDFNHYGVQAILWSRDRVNRESQEYIRGLPYVIENEEATFVHASPAAPEEWQYVLSMRSAQNNFHAFSTRICFIGHSHVPVVIPREGPINEYRPGHRHIINVGSVGQPRDGNPDASFGLFDAGADLFELIRVPYDVARTAKAIRAAGLPEFLAQRLSKGM
jgi:diadenosine tetraphosphatase ApaH/serine/threonine PP2A family protein phosphatase